MKKQIITWGLMFAATLALSVSCAKEQDVLVKGDESLEPVGVPFELFAGVDTKTATADGATFTWSENDALNVFYREHGTTGAYSSNNKFDWTSGSSFNGTLAAALEDGKNYDWWALYPYSSYITTPANTSAGYLPIGTSGVNKTTGISAALTQVGNDSKAHLAGRYFPLFGKVENVAADTKPSIALSQVMSVLKIHVTNTSGESLTVANVSVTAPQDIVGTYYIDFSTASPSFVKSSDDYVSATANLTVSDGSAIATGGEASGDFYVAIKPFTQATASTLTVSVNGYEKDVVIPASTEFKPGKIKTVNFSYDHSSDVVEPTTKTGWYRVEKASWLQAGDRVVIANNDGTKAMSKTQKNNNRDGIDITTGKDGDYTVLTHNDDFQMFILETGSVAGSFAYWSDNGGNPNQYMCAASSSSNNLKFKNEIDGNSSFIANLTGGLGSLTAQGSYSRKVVQWNNLFNCYSAASYSAISIYKYYGTYSGPTTCATPSVTQEGALISISTTTLGATLYYTIDGSTPTSSSTKYTAPFTVTESVTVKAIAIRSHYSDSEVSSKACSAKVVTPEISSSANAFTITCATEGVTIYYETSTTNLESVATPTTTSSVYSAPVAYDATTYVKAIAVKDGYTNSDVASATCTYSSGGGSTPKEVTLQYTTNSTTNMTGENDAATVGLDETKWSVVGAKGNSNNYPGLNKAKDIRLYWADGGSNTLTVTALEAGATINSITITYTGDSFNNGVVLVGGNPVSIFEGSYPINSTSFVISNGNTTNVQVRISKIVINYSTSD